jgi:hypothetical protein
MMGKEVTMPMGKGARTWAPAALVVATGVIGVGVLGSQDAGAVGGSPRATITGTAQITGAPTGWQNAGFYVQACRARVSFSDGCKGGETAAPKSSPGSYTLGLNAGSWKVGLYYYTEHGQIINNIPAKITVSSGQKAKMDLAVAYVIPAADGTVHLTGAPKNFNSKAYMGVQGCPAGKTGCSGGTEAYEDILPGHPYSIDLSPGSWNIYAYYRQDGTNQTFTGKPVAVTATAGQTVHMNLSIAYQGL